MELSSNQLSLSEEDTKFIDPTMNILEVSDYHESDSHEEDELQEAIELQRQQETKHKQESQSIDDNNKESDNDYYHPAKSESNVCNLA
jgi:hypothetical protein